MPHPAWGCLALRLATVLGRISFKKTPMEIEGGLLVFFFSSLPSLSFKWEITNSLPNRRP